jgi:hypothetical protein
MKIWTKSKLLGVFRHGNNMKGKTEEDRREKQTEGARGSPDTGLVSEAYSNTHWMQEGLFFFKKTWKYCDGVLKYFTVFSPEKLQKNKSYYMNVLFQIILKEYYIFYIIFFEYFASYIIFLTYFLNFIVFLLYFIYK